MFLADPTSVYAWLVTAEIGFVFLLALRKFLQSSTRSLALFVLVGILGAAFFNQLYASGRPILSVEFFMPSSVLTRWNFSATAPYLRRLAEPLFWTLILTLLALGKGRWLPTAAYLLTALLCLESFILQSSWQEWSLTQTHFKVLQLLHVAGVQGVFVCFFFGLQQSDWEYHPKFLVRSLGALSLLFLPLLFGWCAVASPLRIGAHYYTWFPENWVAGFLGEKLRPPVLPELKLYESDDVQVINQHLQWAKDAGLDFFVVDWWPNKYHARKRADKFAQLIAGDQQMRFAVQYEAEDLKEKGDAEVKGEHGNIIYLTPERRGRLAKHWLRIAKNFLENPRYLRIGDRPVLFVYSTRHLVGPVREAIWQARQRVYQATGLELFIVADEAFPNVLDYETSSGVFMRPPLSPNWERISAFDALTIYNPYDPEKSEHAGMQGAEKFFRDSRLVYDRYQQVARAAGIEFWPTVIPGYNDRGVRPAENHYVLPRALSEHSPEGFFEKGLGELLRPYIDRSNRMAMVTSWNEWNEWTQIEPTAESPVTNLDSSGNAATFAHGEMYRGYGVRYLELLKKWKTSADFH